MVSHRLKHSQPDFAQLVLQGVGLLYDQCASLLCFLRGPRIEETQRVNLLKTLVFGPQLRTNLHKEVTVLHCKRNVLHSISVLHQMLAHL